MSSMFRTSAAQAAIRQYLRLDKVKTLSPREEMLVTKNNKLLLLVEKAKTELWDKLKEAMYTALEENSNTAEFELIKLPSFVVNTLTFHLSKDSGKSKMYVINSNNPILKEFFDYSIKDIGLKAYITEAYSRLPGYPKDGSLPSKIPMPHRIQLSIEIPAEIIAEVRQEAEHQKSLVKMVEARREAESQRK